MRKSGKASADDMNWDDYHDYETMYAWIDSLVERYPGIVSVEEIGKTHEGRPIRVVKISKNPVLELRLFQFIIYRLIVDY